VAQTADNSLEQRIADLESSVRALQAVAAVGGTSVAASNAAALTLTGVASTVGGVDWAVNIAAGPTVDLYVQGGRLRIDVAASFEVYGNKCSLFAGYRILGPAPLVDPTTNVPDFTGAAVAVAPSYEKAAQLQDDGVGMNQLGAFGTFDVVTGLTVGWYRVSEVYALGYSATSGAPYGIASARRLTVTRY
jgi:hypothetical protein